MTCSIPRMYFLLIFTKHKCSKTFTSASKMHEYINIRPRCQNLMYIITIMCQSYNHTTWFSPPLPSNTWCVSSWTNKYQGQFYKILIQNNWNLVTKSGLWKWERFYSDVLGIESINSTILTFKQCHMALIFPIPRLITMIS